MPLPEGYTSDNTQCTNDEQERGICQTDSNIRDNPQLEKLNAYYTTL